MDLLIIVLLAIITLPIVIFTEGALRIILAIIFVIISPGYSLISALFPRKDSISGVERATLSLVLSFALVVLCGLILNYTPWGIRVTPIIIILSIVIYIMVSIAFIRRWRLPEYDRFSIKLKIPRIHWGTTGNFDKILSFILVLAIIGAIATSAYLLAKPKVEENFTNFYLLGSEGKMENYPQETILGGQVEIAVGIENFENKSVDYDILVTIDSEAIAEIKSIELANGEIWSEEITITPEKTGDKQRVDFSLYKDNGVDPYLKLHFWLDVKEPNNTGT